MVLELLLDVLEMLLEVLDLALVRDPVFLLVFFGFIGFQCLCFSWLWANYKDDTYVGTLDGSFQLPGTSTGTSLRPVKDIILDYMLGLKLPRNMRF